MPNISLEYYKQCYQWANDLYAKWRFNNFTFKNCFRSKWWCSGAIRNIFLWKKPFSMLIVL
jgi:hypothetical protein